MLFAALAAALIPVTLIAAPATATSNPLMTPPTLTIDSAGVLSITSGAWSNQNYAIQREVVACRSAVSKQDTLATMADLAEVFRVSVCLNLSQASSAANFPTNLNTAFISSGASSWAPFEASSGRNFIAYIEFDSANQSATWTESVQFGTSSAGSPAGPSQFSQAQMDPGLSYGGPAISGLDSSRANIRYVPGELVFAGKRMHLVTSVTVGGFPASISPSIIKNRPGGIDLRSLLGITFSPLTPGMYEVVLTSKNHGSTKLMVFIGDRRTR